VEIFSKVVKNKLLHKINRCADITKKRNDLSPSSEYLQVSTFKLEKDKTFRAHKHINTQKITDITQESWVIISGRVRVYLYDLDDSIIFSDILGPGDCSISYCGGHNYMSLEEGTTVYEFKTGPYLGQHLDKVFI